MTNRADIEVSGRNGEPLAVVEVKRLRHTDSKAAGQWRQNMLLYGLVPRSEYFLLVTPERVFVWRQVDTEAVDDRLPTTTGSTSSVLGPFLRAARLGSTDISEDALELATAAWLAELARDTELAELPPAWLASTGLPEAIRGGEVRLQVAA